MGMSGDTALVLAKSYVKKTLQGQGALKGQDGFSPTVKENPNNTDDNYRLDVTDKNGTFTTPNLKGADGSGSDYKQLKNKPSIGGVELDGNKTLDDLGIQQKIDEINSNLDNVYESAFDGKLDADIHWVNGTIKGTGDSSTVGNTATIISNSPYNKTRRCAFYDLKSDMTVKFLNTCVLHYTKVDSNDTILGNQVNVTSDFVLKKGRYALVFYIQDVSDLTNYKISDYINMYYDIPIFDRVTAVENDISKNKESIDMLNLTTIRYRTHNTGFPTSEKIWANYSASSVFNHVIFQVSGGETVTIKSGTTQSTFYGCLKTYSVPSNGDSVDYSTESRFTNRRECAKNNTVTFDIPSDARYLFIVCTYGNTDTTPVICKIDGLDYAKQFASNAIVDLIDSKLSRTVRWCAIGDSITEGYISCEKEPKYKLSKSDAWAYKLAKITGWELTNNAIGGTGFIRNHPDSEDAGWNVVKNIDFTQFDFVTIAYGVNDWKYNCTLGTFNDDIENPTTIYGAMRSTIETIIASNPLCKIFIISPVNCSAFGSESGNWGISYSFSNNGTLEQIFEAEKTVAEYYGIEFIDMLHNSIINRKNIKTCLIDNVHPSADTHTVMAHEIGGRLRWKY